MPQYTAFDSTPASSTTSTTSRSFGAVLRKLSVTVVLVAACGALAFTAFTRTDDVNDTPRPIPAPSAAPAAKSAGDDSVPDASTVFSGREAELEEPASTF
jgi:hypothetical protein